MVARHAVSASPARRRRPRRPAMPASTEPPYADASPPATPSRSPRRRRRIRTGPRIAVGLSSERARRIRAGHPVLRGELRGRGPRVLHLAEADAETATGDGPGPAAGVIGKTARLEQRPILAIVPGGPDVTRRAADLSDRRPNSSTRNVQPTRSDDKEVVYLDQNRATQVPARARRDHRQRRHEGQRGPQRRTAGGAAVGRELRARQGRRGCLRGRHHASPAPSDPQKRIAIVVDARSSPAPSVQGPITGGSGADHRRLHRAEAKDLATC